MIVHTGNWVNKMWMALILICNTPMAQSCVLITGDDLKPTKEACFEFSIKKAELALTFPQVFQAKTFCQIIPNGEKT